MIFESKEVKAERKAQGDLIAAEAVIKQLERDLAAARIRHAEKMAIAQAARRTVRQSEIEAARLSGAKA